MSFEKTQKIRTYRDRVLKCLARMTEKPIRGDIDHGGTEGVETVDEHRPSARWQWCGCIGKHWRASLNSGIGHVGRHAESNEL